MNFPEAESHPSFDLTSASNAFRDHFCRIMVNLAVWMERSGRRQLVLGSGFVMEHEGQFAFVTAGHCIHDLKEMAASGWTIESAGMIENTGNAEDSFIPTVLDLETALYATQDDQFDFGFLFLSANTYALLRANGVEFVPTTHVGSHLWDYEAYAVIGTPLESVEWISREGGDKLRKCPLPLFVDRLPDETLPDGNPRLVFQAHPVRINGRRLQSPVGMSGGPIIGIKRLRPGEPGIYQIIGVQSSWVPGKWKLFGTPIFLIAAMVDGRLAEAQRILTAGEAQT